MASKYKCASCEVTSMAGDINEKTLTECCFNRTERRKFVPIERTVRGDRKWYRCPACEKDIRRRGWIDNE